MNREPPVENLFAAQYEGLLAAWREEAKQHVYGSRSIMAALSS